MSYRIFFVSSSSGTLIYSDHVQTDPFGRVEKRKLIEIKGSKSFGLSLKIIES